MKKYEEYACVWDAIADTPESAATLRLRAELARKIVLHIRRSGWGRRDAALICGVTQPRLDELLDGRISKFSLDALIDVVTATGCRVQFELV